MDGDPNQNRQRGRRRPGSGEVRERYLLFVAGGVVGSLALAWMLVAAVVLYVWTATPAAAQPTSGSPFAGLYALEGVDTSRDEYAIWISWVPDRFRIRYLDGGGYFEGAGDGELFSALTVRCRADGRRAGYGGPEAATAVLLLPMHPNEEDAYTVDHPMYWILGVFGGAAETTPVRFWRPGGRMLSAHMLRRVTTYSTPRPEREVQLPTAAVLHWLAEGRPMRLSVSGDAVDAYLWFAARPALVEPARLAAAHCDGDHR